MANMNDILGVILTMVFVMTMMGTYYLVLEYLRKRHLKEQPKYNTMNTVDIIQKFADSIDGLGDYSTSQAIKNQIEKTLIPVVANEESYTREEVLLLLVDFRTHLIDNNLEHTQTLDASDWANKNLK